MYNLLALALACVGSAADQSDVKDSTPTSVGDPGSGDPSLMCNVSVSCSGNIIDDPKAPCQMSIESGDGILLYDGPAGFELRGRSSLVFPKPQYSLELRDWTELPVWPGSWWSYHDGGTDLGTAWRDPDYDSSTWAAGSAPLGYGEAYLNTSIDSGADPEAVNVTTYYRYAFTVAGFQQIKQLKVGLMRNDGAAVYLNGVEILRDNLPANAAYDTLATETISQVEDILWVAADIDPALLVDGSNVLAVEVHQADLASTDSRFDFYLEASGEEAGVDLFGMGKDADWILNGMYVDRSLFRNKLAYDLFQSFGGDERYATDGVYCELTLNETYQGIYSLGEKIEPGDHRLDIADGDVEDGAFIVKLDDTEGFYPNAVGNGTWEVVYPTNDPTAEADIAAYLSGWEGAIKGGDPGNPDTGIFSYVDMDSAVDWVLLEEFMKNVDGYYLSVHLWKDVDGKMFFAPWDLDLSMGYPYTDCGSGSWLYYRPEFIQAMADRPEFKAAMVERWLELRQGPLSDETIAAKIAAYDSTLGDAVERNFQRWPMEEIAYATDTEPNWLCPVASYEVEHARVLEFIAGRLLWMDTYVDTF